MNFRTVPMRDPANQPIPGKVAPYGGNRAQPNVGGSLLGNLPARVHRMLKAWNDIGSASDAIQQFPSAFEALPRPTRAFRPSGITAVQAPGTGQPVAVRWPQSCFVVGITFGTIEGTAAALSAMSVRVQVEATLDIFTDGQTGAFLHVGSLGSFNGIAMGAYYPFIRWADQSTNWQVTIKNESAGTNFTPVVQFLIVDPRDLPDLFQQQA